MRAIEPVLTRVDFETGIMEPSDRITMRKLTDMKGAFHDKKSLESLINEENAVVYEVSEREFPRGQGHLTHAVTKVRPGKVGAEYYLTLGHFHTDEAVSELHIILRGEGYLLFVDGSGAHQSMEIRPSRAAYLPPGWACRIINTGRQDLVVMNVFPADAVHDQQNVMGFAFPIMVIEKDGQPVVVDNPRFRKGRKKKSSKKS